MVERHHEGRECGNGEIGQRGVLGRIRFLCA